MLGGKLAPIVWTSPSGEANRRMMACESTEAPMERLSQNWPPSAADIRTRLPATIRTSFLRPTLTTRIRPTTSRATTASGMTGSSR